MSLPFQDLILIKPKGCRRCSFYPVTGEIQFSQVPELTWWLRLQAVSWPSGEMDIPSYKQASPMVECHPEGPHAESLWLCPRPTGHLFSPTPGFILALHADGWDIFWVHCAHLGRLLIFKNLFLNLRNGYRLYSLSFGNSEWQRWRRKKDAAIWSQAMAFLLICLRAQRFSPWHHKACPCWEELTSLTLTGDWLLIPH